MSFMFSPYPYVDHNAVNHVSGKDFHQTAGVQAVAKDLAALLLQGKNIGLDLYPGANPDGLVTLLRRLCGNKVLFLDAKTLLKPASEITSLLAPYLPMDRDADPVLLYGRRYPGGYQGLQDENAVAQMRQTLADTHGCLVFGAGALAASIRGCYDIRVFMDITPREAAIAFKNGRATNIGAEHEQSFNLTMRRNYYVDFETAVNLRWDLIRENALDYYITADIPDQMQMTTFDCLKKLFDELCEKPLRCRPVYLEGVWGGYYIHRLRHLPKEMRNCAWVFDMIPMEVSLAARLPEGEFEVPFFTFVQVMREKLLGKKAYETFGGYFPIRFNYDDTYHASGNMSIQCHPDAAYVMRNHGELGRQDESYYVCVTGQNAKTYLGFREKDSCEKFFSEARRAEQTGELIPYENYIHAVPSVPGTQVMIPAGTIHASGKNQVILEIGSLTIGSYTYKLYDYQRIDPGTGLPRPIHLKMGAQVIRAERDRDYVEQNLVNHGGLVRQGSDWKEIIVGEHELLYFSLRNLIFDTAMRDDTAGQFHVLALVDGEKVKVASAHDPQKSYVLSSLDIVVVPADFGEYELTNLGVGTVTVHKTLLK